MFKPDADVETDDLDLVAVERAYKIIKLYNDTPNATPGLKEKYEVWLISGHQMREKNEAMRRIFEEMMEDSDMWIPEESGETEESEFSMVGEKVFY